MTRTIKIILKILAVLLAVIPFGLLVAFNILYPEATETLTRFRICTVLYILCNFILIPILISAANGDGEHDDLIILIITVQLAVSIFLWYSAGWRNFWGIFARSAHPLSTLEFYLLLVGTWVHSALVFHPFVLSSDLFDNLAGGVTISVAEHTPFKGILRSFAEMDEDEIARQIAAERLEDQKDLEHVLLWGKYDDSRAEAVKKITNPGILSDIAENDESKEVRLEAVKLVTDDVVLGRIAENDKSPSVRLEAVSRLSDQDKLKSIALTDKTPSIRLAALERISGSPELFANLAVNDENEKVRELSAKKTADPKVLAEIILNDPSYHVREAVIGNISDPEVLTEVIKNDSIYSLRKKALDRIQDPEILNQAALTNSMPMIRRDAVSRITDQETLVKAVQNDEEPKVRLEAALRLTDPDILASVALLDDDLSVRRRAVERSDIEALEKAVLTTQAEKVCFPMDKLKEVTDPSVWIELSEKDNDPLTRQYALGKIDDPVQLKKIAKRDPDPDLRIAALAKISDLAFIMSAAEKDKDETVRLAAVRRIDDRECLTRIAKRDSRSAVRLAALRKVDDESLLRWVVFNEDDIRILEYAVSQSKDFQAKILGYEKILKKDPHNVNAAGKLRDLYQRNLIARRIGESHSDVHEDNNESAYCCYSDYTDHNDTTYFVENL